MNNIKIFENDLPDEIDLSEEKVIGIDNEALGLVWERSFNFSSIRSDLKNFI